MHIKFGSTEVLKVKGRSYRYSRIEMPQYTQSAITKLTEHDLPTVAAYIVLWDIAKYTTNHVDKQAKLTSELAENVTRTLKTYGLDSPAYSPAGDGGYAVLPDRIQAFEFAKFLLKYSRNITIRVGIHDGSLAQASRG